MINVAVCDDNSNFVSILQQYIKRYREEKKINLSIECFESGEEFLQIYCHQFNIIFLDIKMKKVNGIEVAKTIRKVDSEVIIVFVTSIFDYISMGYILDISNYLIKPIQYGTFQNEMDRLIIKCQRQDDGFIIVDNDSGSYKLFFNRIKYIETYKHNILFRLDDNTSVVCYNTMKNMETFLKNQYFSRCHASYIVNLRFVTRFSKLIITLKTNEEIPVSQNKRANFMKDLANYFEKNRM